MLSSTSRQFVRHSTRGRAGGRAASYASFPGSRVALPRNWGFVVVPQTQVFIVERLGRYSQSLTGGWHLLIPFVDRIAYAHSLKETALAIPSQTAITKDNVTIGIDGVLYLRTNDPYAASYGISDAVFAVTQLAQVRFATSV